MRASKESTLRIVSYNIHKGFTAGNRSFVLQKMKEAIHLVHADLVLLQEVLGEHEKHARTIQDWPRDPQFEFLAGEVWPHFAYGKNCVYSSGHHGNAILSKYPILKWSNMDLSTNRFESRGVLHAIIDFPGSARPLHCLCLHLNLLDGGRKKQLSNLCARIMAEIPADEAFILAGDFNDWSGTATGIITSLIDCKEVFQLTSGAHARTFPSRFPLLKLDRIYCRGLLPVEAQVLTGEPWERLSDHAALYAELEVSSTK